MAFIEDTLAVERVDDRHWMLLRAMTYEGQRDKFRIPAGYKTDFASVPKILQWFAPSTGPYTQAAVLHDYLCDSLNEWGYVILPNRYDVYPLTLDGVIASRDVDGLFRRVMREEGVPLALRWFMWTGVRWGALFNRRRRPGIGKDMPLVLLWSLLALPIVLPALLVILAGLGIYYAVELIAGSFE